MSESRSHALLFQGLIDWIIQTHLDGEATALLIDSAAVRQDSRPPQIPNFIPDAYTKIAKRHRVIVGEAKTPKDLITEHSERQLTEFLKHCALFDNGLLVLAVPWYTTKTARSVMNRLQRRSGTETVTVTVIEKLSA